MSILYQCVCGANTKQNDTAGWSQMESVSYNAETDSYDLLHFCPACSAAVRQIAQDTHDDNQKESI